MRNACIIQAVGSDGSEARQRADLVLQSIIEPACRETGYEAVRANDLQNENIAEPIISALNTYPLVIADLGAPPWNPNVMIEVGFRLAIGRPIICLADADPKSQILPLSLRKVPIHTIDPAMLGQADVDGLAESIKKYGREVNYWESDYPTIEFSISKSADGGRFIFANKKAARLYGLSDPDDLIGRPVNEVDNRLQNYIPKEHYEKYGTDQYAMLGKIMGRAPGPKTAKVPLWFIKHEYPEERDRIYWPVLVQYRFASIEDVVMRVIFIDVSEWDAMAPPPRQPPQSPHLPELFRDVRRPATPEYDIFLSYNSKDAGYVNELYQMLVRCGLKVWFDVNEFGGMQGLSRKLIEASNRSRIFVSVLGRSGLGQWQEQIELETQLLGIIRGQKPFILLLLPEVQSGDSAWKTYLTSHLVNVFEDRLRVQLPPVEQLRSIMQLDRPPIFVERMLRLIVQILRSQEEP